MTATAIVMAGVPATNLSLYRRIRFLVGDPVAHIALPANGASGSSNSVLIMRDIELDRAREKARADQVVSPKDFAPESGLSGDRETATAQAAAECLRRSGVKHVVADRTLPLIFAHVFHEAGMTVTCDPEMGVTERRMKDGDEIAALREAQAETERAMEMACTLVARASADADGALQFDGATLTSERVRAEIDVTLLRAGYQSAQSIVAGGPIGADCHDRGHGVLRTGQPVIIDIFPQNRTTLYNGDCSRTVVHGDVPDEVTHMHAVVVEAKAAATAATRAGVTGEAVHAATAAVIEAHGYGMGMTPDDAPPTWCGMTHGTGHGIGLDVHEPPLLDHGGPELVVGDALTIEPGLYCRAIGGIRVEDMVIVTADGCTNLNQLHEGLDWS